LAVVFLCILVVSCGPNLSGTFNFELGLVGQTEFHNNKNVVLSVWGFNFPTTYRSDGDYIYIKHDKGGEFSYKVKTITTQSGEGMLTDKSKRTKE